MFEKLFLGYLEVSTLEFFVRIIMMCFSLATKFGSFVFVEDIESLKPVLRPKGTHEILLHKNV